MKEPCSKGTLKEPIVKVPLESVLCIRIKFATFAVIIGG